MATINGTSGPDHLVGTAGDDTIYGLGGNDLIEGLNGNDWLFGGSGNDVLIGGAGYNDYWGGSGYDTFTTSDRVGAGFSDDLIHDLTFDIDHIDVSAWGVSDFGQIRALLFTNQFGDAALDAFYGGIDHFLTIEGVAPGQLIATDFIYSNAGPKTETGTAADDVLFGTRFGDTLDGGAGDDVLLGGGGNDVLIGGFGIDYFDGGAGRDQVSYAYSSQALTIDLRTGVATFDTGTSERLVSIEDATGGSNDDTIIGNSGANTLNGRGGNDLLDGRGGTDVLIGGPGNDIFVFDTALGSGNVDTVQAFSAADDVIWLGDSVFTVLPTGTLAASRYAEGNFSAAQDAGDRIIYNNMTGDLFYDRDGIGGLASIKFGHLDPGLAPTLSNVDFFVV